MKLLNELNISREALRCFLETFEQDCHSALPTTDLGRLFDQCRYNNFSIDQLAEVDQVRPGRAWGLSVRPPARDVPQDFADLLHSFPNRLASADVHGGCLDCGGNERRRAKSKAGYSSQRGPCHTKWQGHRPSDDRPHPASDRSVWSREKARQTQSASVTDAHGRLFRCVPSRGLPAQGIVFRAVP